MKSTAPDTSFKFFPQLNELEDKGWCNSGTRFRPSYYEAYFKGDSLQSKILKELAYEKLLPIKEVLECFEYFGRIRKRVRADVMCDLCSGHGFLGILFAIFERKVNKVFLVDKVEPQSRQKLISCLVKVAPWIEEKVYNCKELLTEESEWLEEGMSVVSAHACGTLTDLCIDIALKTGGNVAVMPCCYPERKCKAPIALQANLGFETAFDIDRTYKLEQAGYHVHWDSISAAVTPMNRIITGKKI